MQFVRVTDPKSGARITITAARADRLGLKPLKRPAVDRTGRPLPAKSRADLSPSREVTTDAPSSTTTPKENP